MYMFECMYVTYIDTIPRKTPDQQYFCTSLFLQRDFWCRKYNDQADKREQKQKAYTKKTPCHLLFYELGENIGGSPTSEKNNWIKRSID